MPKQYQVTSATRFANRIMMQLMRWGVTLPHMALLTVRGRKSGQAYSLPVQPVEEDGKRWLVSPYGETNWVKNARAAGEVTLLCAGRAGTVRLHELGPQEAAPILKKYLSQVPIVRPYFEVQPDAPMAVFAAEAPRHPVFLIEP